MKLKTLLLTGLATLAGGMMAQADSVYSVNVVGYVNLDIPANSFSLISNPVSQTNNALKNILPGAPTGITVYKFNGAAFSSFQKLGSSWLPNGDAIFNPGEGFFVKNATANPVTLSFIGEVPTGTLNVPISSGFNLLASPVPQVGKVQTDLLLPAVNGEKIYQFKVDTYVSFQKIGAWAPSEPTINPGEGFWYSASSAKTWSRTFNVNQ